MSFFAGVFTVPNFHKTKNTKKSQDYEVDMGAQHKFPLPKHFIEMRHKLIVGGVSSTELRKRIKEIRKAAVKPTENTAAALFNIAGLTTKSVIEYILTSGVYA